MMTRARGELPEPEEQLLGIERPTPEQEEAAKKISDEKAELRRVYMLQLMQTPLFREWLWGFLQECRTFNHTFGVSPTGFPDPDGTQYALGLRQAGWNLWEFFDDIAPDYTSLMRREAKQPKG